MTLKGIKITKKLERHAKFPPENCREEISFGSYRRREETKKAIIKKKY